MPSDIAFSFPAPPTTPPRGFRIRYASSPPSRGAKEESGFESEADLTGRPPLQTPHAHIYRSPLPHLYGPTAHRESLYVNSPSPPELEDIHPAFRRKTSGHVPITISQDLVDRVSKRNSQSKRKFGAFRRPSLRSQPAEKAHYDDKQPAPSFIVKRDPEADNRPRHVPIVIPGFIEPRCFDSRSRQNSSPTPPLSRSDTLISRDSEHLQTPRWSLEQPRLLLNSEWAAPLSPISIAHLDKLQRLPVPLGKMSRPTTGGGGGGGLGGGNFSASGDGNGSSAGTAVPDYSSGLIPASTENERPQLSMSSSQLSFTSDAGRQGEDAAAAAADSYTSPPQSARTVTSPLVEPRTPTATASSNLSGLVCNVHRCTGKEPRGLVGATTTILGDKLYVFGGRSLSKRRPHMTSDLHELDLIHRHWSKIKTKGQIPSPRYFHSVCALGDSKLICYGGMSPAPPNPGASQASPTGEQSDVVVMSDVHIYDTKTRTWTRIDTQDTPQGRYAHCAAVLPSTAVFSSASAPLSAIHHNPSEIDSPNSGQLGIALDGTGGAEMMVVGGQDNANHYIEQISVFNLRSLKWTSTNSLGRSCGAYRSVVAPLVGFPASKIGAGIDAAKNADKDAMTATDSNSMLIYSNYNFLNVKLDLQCRTQDGRLEEKPMDGEGSPPGLRFPNGGVLNNHLIVSGTYLSAKRQEYALWALDLRTQIWSRIEVGGSVFGQGSWNRGVLWPKRNTFVILGHRKRNLVEDYNHRRINFTNICLVELEAFGYYDNPRHANPTSSYSSYSAPELPTSLRPKSSLWSGGGRPHHSASEELGRMLIGVKQLSDMDILTLNGEKIPVNSHVLSRRWGAYFVQILREGANTPPEPANMRSMDGDMLGPGDNVDGQTIRNAAGYRNSSVTITPSIATAFTNATTLTVGSGGTGGSATVNGSLHGHSHSGSISTGVAGLGHEGTNGVNGVGAGDDTSRPFHAPSPTSLPASSRSRTLYLPHSAPTVRALVYYLYTSALPPVGNTLSTPQILCSLLQLARPYRIDGLLEAVLERLHQVMDSRSAAAVFNACAMAAGGGRDTGFERLGGAGMLSEAEMEEASIMVNAERGNGAGANGFSTAPSASRTQPRTNGRTRGAMERKNTFDVGGATGRSTSQSSAAGGISTDVSEDEGASGTDTDAGNTTDGSEVWDDGVGGVPGPGTVSGVEEEIWTGDRSCVIGLQKRGLRGLMEGRRMMRERGESTGGERRGTH